MPEKLTAKDKFLKFLKIRSSAYAEKRAQDAFFDLSHWQVERVAYMAYHAGAKYGWKKRSEL